MGTADERFRQRMAGGVGRLTVPEHAGQVPEVRQHHIKEQRNNSLQH